MAAPVEEENDPFADDFYSLLNISRDASSEEVCNAYRRFSKIYHPDKHVDPKKKKDAEIMFFKIKRAYEVLVDEHTRVIYDLYGAKGLETEGLQVISRTKSPAEIVAEYERLQREREERILEKCTNPKGTIVVAVDATDVFEPYDVDDTPPGSRIPNIEISKMSLTQSVDAPLTTRDTTTLAANLMSDNGVGVGSFVCQWRRLVSHRGWVETSVGNGLGLAFHGFRQINKSCYGTVSTNLVLGKSGEVKRNLMATVAIQLSKHLKGQMAYSFLHPSHLTTSVVFDSEHHHAVCSVQLGIRETFLLVSYTRKFMEGKLRLAAKMSHIGGQVECGVTKKLTQFSDIGASVAVGVPYGVTVKLKLIRGNQTIICPIHLSETVVPSAIFYGLVTPLIAYQVIRHLVVKPFLKQQRDIETERKRENFSERLQQEIAEAAAAVALMKDTVVRIMEVEEARKGLVILKATYGKISTSDDLEVTDSQCLDVTIPLQALVKDSRLILPDSTSKSSIAGFYDPCFGEEKQLYVRYRFHNKLHQLTIADSEPLKLPQQKHLVTNENAT